MSTKPDGEFKEKLETMTELVEVGATYRHYKSPDMLYKVGGLAIHSDTHEVYISYDALYGAEIPYVKPLKHFLDFVKFEGTTVPRFTLVED